MRPFKRSMVVIDLDPVIEEALTALPFIRPEFQTWFADLIASDDSFYVRGLREGGTRITPDERIGLGLEKWAGDKHLSWEVWNALTDQARLNAADNFDVLCDRICWNAWRIADRIKDNEFLNDGLFFNRARFKADHLTPCAVARATHGAVWQHIPEVPFGSCSHPVCRCGWSLLSARE